MEILERRYPVLVHEFGIREGSGGRGRFNGGDGVIRDIEFLEEIRVSILSEVCVVLVTKLIVFTAFTFRDGYMHPMVLMEAGQENVVETCGLNSLVGMMVICH